MALKAYYAEFPGECFVNTWPCVPSSLLSFIGKSPVHISSEFRATHVWNKEHEDKYNY